MLFEKERDIHRDRGFPATVRLPKCLKPLNAGTRNSLTPVSPHPLGRQELKHVGDHMLHPGVHISRELDKKLTQHLTQTFPNVAASLISNFSPVSRAESPSSFCSPSTWMVRLS